MSQPKNAFRSSLSIPRIFLALCLVLVLTSCFQSHKPDEDSYKHNANFPAEIALAAYGKKTPKEEIQCEFDTTDLKKPSSLDKNKLKKAVEKAKGEGPFTEQQAEEAIEIIQTGQFYKDISSTVIVTKDFWAQAIKDTVKLKIINFQSGKCLASETFNNKKLSSKAIKCVYEHPTIKQAAEAASILLDTDSIRLAIIVYARANGVNLKNEDLDVLNDTALDTDNPDLNALVDHGVERLKKEYGADKAEKILKAMKSGEMICNNADSG